MTGWRLTSWASATALVVQGAMAAWLSFWVTAFLFHKYSPRLALFVGFAVGAGGGLVAVAGIFKRVQSSNQVVGELVAEANAPLLWQRIRHLAQRLKTEPPRHIVAGIDANFSVTKAPITVGQQTLTGRTLFVSLPLLQILAYRYEPANEQGRALVLQYFPPVVFALKGDATVEVSIDGIRTSTDETTVFWDPIKGLQFKEGSFGNALIVTHPEKNALGLGAKTSKIKLPGLKKDKDQFNAVVSHYWQRHQIMRAQQQAVG